MNPDDIATETIMPEAFLALAREMVAQKSPEAAATAALAWALRHAPVDGGSLEIAGHRIERIAPEPDPWPTADLLAWRGMLWARVAGNEPGTRRYYAVDALDEVWEGTDSPFRYEAVPVTVVPVAEWEAMKSDHRTRSHLVDGCHICALIAATDVLEVDL